MRRGERRKNGDIGGAGDYKGRVRQDEFCVPLRAPLSFLPILNPRLPVHSQSFRVPSFVVSSILRSLSFVPLALALF